MREGVKGGIEEEEEERKDGRQTGRQEAITTSPLAPPTGEKTIKQPAEKSRK